MANDKKLLSRLLAYQSGVGQIVQQLNNLYQDVRLLRLGAFRRSYDFTSGGTIASDADVVRITAISAPMAITLPSAAAAGPERRLLVMDESGSVTTTNTVTISAGSGDTLKGGNFNTETQVRFADGFLFAEFISNGATYWQLCATNVGWDE